MIRAQHLEDLARAVELAKLGARPPVIRDLCRSVPSTESIRIYTEVVGVKPPQGQLPSRHESLMETQRLRWHGSVIAAAFGGVRDTMERYQDAYVAAYRHYQEVLAGEELLYSFDRAWMLLRQLSIKNISTVTCGRCDANYIHNNQDLLNHERNCPVCVAVRRNGQVCQVQAMGQSANLSRSRVRLAAAA